jgi:hypothetical protein
MTHLEGVPLDFLESYSGRCACCRLTNPAANFVFPAYKAAWTQYCVVQSHRHTSMVSPRDRGSVRMVQEGDAKVATAGSKGKEQKPAFATN